MKFLIQAFISNLILKDTPTYFSDEMTYYFLYWMTGFKHCSNSESLNRPPHRN